MNVSFKFPKSYPIVEINWKPKNCCWVLNHFKTQYAMQEFKRKKETMKNAFKRQKLLIYFLFWCAPRVTLKIAELLHFIKQI